MSGTVVEDIKRARNVVIAAYLSWTLDAFDFFILIFTFDDVAKTFGVSVTSITFYLCHEPKCSLVGCGVQQSCAGL